MNYSFFIFFFIVVDMLSASVLIASYAITEQELFDLRTQAKAAWPNITDEETFKKEIDDFSFKNLLPLCGVKDEDFFFILPKNLLNPIWINDVTSDQDMIIACDNKQFYCRLIPKGIVIRNSWMKNKGLTSTAEPQTLQFYYGLLKGLFLENEEALFLYTVCTLIKNTKHSFGSSIPIVCMLKGELEHMSLKNQSQKYAYHMHVAYSVMASFLLHKLFETINSTNNNQTLRVYNSLSQPLQQGNQINKPEPEVKLIDSAKKTTLNNNNGDLKNQNDSQGSNTQPSLDKNNNKNNITGSLLLYSMSASLVIAILLILLDENFDKLLNIFRI